MDTTKKIGGKTLFLERNEPYTLEVESFGTSQKILAFGAEMASVFCFYDGERFFVSRLYGDTKDEERFSKFREDVEEFLKGHRPEVLLCDMHPSYNVSLYAQELQKRLNIPLVKVQHHKAHAYSVAGEYELRNFVAIVCDGLGYGDDGTIWGGEIFDTDERIGHLEEHLQLGGDLATLKPSRMLFSILRKFLSFEEAKNVVSHYFEEKELLILNKQLEQQFNCPITTSTGRILDAATVLLGFFDEKRDKGIPAIFLERNSTKPYELEPVIEEGVLKTTPLFEYLVNHLDKDKKRLAATVQSYLAKGLYTIAMKKNKPIVFSGGCAYNTIMTTFMLEKGVLINKSVPCGDGGISFGQIITYLANSGDNVS